MRAKEYEKAGKMAAAAGRYQICIQGHLDPAWSDWFGGLEVSFHPEGQTLLAGPVSDQAALYGLLNRLAALGLTLVSVTPLQEREKEVPDESS